MSNQPTINELLERNKELAKTYTPKPTIAEIKSEGHPLPKVLVVTCGDPRCVPEQFLGATAGEIAVFRNVCGHVAAEIPFILYMDLILHFDEVMVVHHTDCGAFQFDDATVRKVLKVRAPEHAAKVDEYTEFGVITDLDQSIKEDVAALKSSSLMRKELVSEIRGFAFDIKTGLLREVEA
ncbi:hypothetical protein TrVFT333_003543 [Trichoderma virens FT-333]|nr:hypothetical protein TrVFT333_003543 [Trichoderma virens FT-333]